MATTERNTKIDILRGIAAVCMVLGHAIIVYPVNLTLIPWCAAIRYFIYTFHMPLFFILSGFVYRCTSYRKYITRKAQRIVLPYLLFESISILLHAFGGSLINGNVSVSDGIRNMLFMGGGYWFLYTIFLVFVLFPFFERFCKTIRSKVIAILVLIWMDQFFIFPDFLCISSIVSYFPYFILGNILKQYGSHTIDNTIRQHSVALFVFCILSYGITNHLLAAELLPSFSDALNFMRAVSISTVLYMLCPVLISSGNAVKTAVRSLLTDCSKYSLQIYLFDGYLVTLLRTLLISVLKIHIPLVIIPCITIINLAVTLCICKFILPRVRLFRTLCGL